MLAFKQHLDNRFHSIESSINKGLGILFFYPLVSINSIILEYAVNNDKFTNI